MEVLDFDAFWKLYPLRVKKYAAQLAFNKLQGQVTNQELLDALRRYTQYLIANPWLSPAHASTWLNQKRWTDEYETPKADDSFSWKALRGTHVSKYQ